MSDNVSEQAAPSEQQSSEPQTAQEALALILSQKEAEANATAAPAETVEAVAEQPKPEEVKPDDKFASKFAALSRKEKEVRQREQRLQNQLKEFESKVKQLEEKMKFSEGWEQEFETDPLTFLEKRGKSYKDLTERFVLKGEETPEDKTNKANKELLSRLEKLEAEIAKRDSDAKAEQERQQKTRQQEAQQTFLKDITKFVNDGGEKYDLIQKNDAVQLVYDVIEEYYNQIITENGDDSSIVISELMEKASDEVENHLLEEAKKLIASNKLKSLLGTPTTQPTKPKTNPVTLSNTASQASTVVQDADSLSADESKRLMAASLKWID